MDIQIRQATIDDIPDIYDLVVELAIYEKQPFAVEATVADYLTDFKEDVFEAIVAVDQGKVVGMMLYYLTYSTWKGRMLYLEDFVIKDAYRRKGIGKKLFDAFVGVAKTRKIRVLKWQVLDWNEPAIKFYKKLNATIETEWWNVKMLQDQIEDYP